ncbi:serine hydrolase [Marilutibacter maris]|nr:serine hydrolase domain-containing protein [Lysobacter maris]
MKRVAVVLLAAACAPVWASEAGKPSLQSLVAGTSEAGAPGCAVGLFRDGQADRMAFAGLADVDAGRPIDGDTLFYAASVSKQFTALAVAQLVADGKLSLDDDVREFIPELPRYSAPVTLSMLLHHTSGVRDFLSLIRMAGLGSASGNTRETALELLYRQQTTNFAPGTQYLYSNGGYLLLAEVVARVSGESFPDYLKRHVLDPLGMRRSHILQGDAEGGNVAHGYIDQAGAFVVRDTYPRFGGSGGLMTSINDLARYQADLASGHVVWTAEIRRILLKPGTLLDGSVALHPKQQLAYAGGLLVGERGGQRVIQHGGSAEAFRSAFARLPDAGIGVAVLCNRGDRNAQALGEQALALYGVALGNTESAADATTIHPGRYRADELGASYEVGFEGERLILRIHSDHAGTAPVTMAFEREEDGRYVGESFSISPAPDGRGLTLGSSRAYGILARPVAP